MHSNAQQCNAQQSKAKQGKAIHGRRIYGWKSKNLRALSRKNESVDKRRGRGRGRE